MTNAHDAFKALAPIDFGEVDQNDPKPFVNETFVDAQCLIDSIPGSIAAKQAHPPTGRPRSATDPTAARNAAKATERAEQLRKEWKEVQLNPRDNPLGVSVYRLNSKDKKGAWFARRSVHQGLTFERWKLGMETEFAESLKVQGKPGDGKIRGIGADKRTVNQTIDGCGKMQGKFFAPAVMLLNKNLTLASVVVYQLSAQFPGPTTPREFITLLLTSDTAVDTPLQAKSRYFLIVSKPCTHPDCPPRNEYIRGQYESVELIREIKNPKPLRKVRSSIDLGKDEIEAERVAAAEALSKEALVRSARQAALASLASDVGGQEGRKRDKTIGFAGTEEDREENDDSETSVEWLMVTRSDPGGSVPRFMVERGTPAGIAGDAKKFLDWVTAMKVDEFPDHDEVSNQIKDQAAAVEEKIPLEHQKQALTQELAKPISHSQQDAQEAIGSGGIYGMISNALGVAASVLPNSLPLPFGSAKGGDSDMSLSSSDLHDDTSSLHSFHSFGSDAMSEKPALDGAALTPSISANTGDVQSTHSSESVTKSNAPSHSEKELRKLEQRREKVNQKLRRAQERALAKKDEESQRDEAAIAKLREKHEREVAKQEAKYRRDMQRLEDKKANEQRKAEERRRKTTEREEKSNLAMELANVRAERDVALKQIDLLKEQVGELQSQNTLLVAKLGRQSKSDLVLADTELSQSTAKKAGVEAA